MSGVRHHQTGHLAGQVFLFELGSVQEGIHLLSKGMRIARVPGPRDG